MINSSKNHPARHLKTSPWIIVGSAFILLVTVVVLAVQNYNREKQYMSSILSEKGAALITTLEAGARTGMMGMMWGGEQIQRLIEETAMLPDVLYITVADENGLVLASSNLKLVGSLQNSKEYSNWIGSTGKVHWRILNNDNQHSFEVYRQFKPISNRNGKLNMHMRQMMQRRSMMMGNNDDWCFPSDKSNQNQLILVGLDSKPFEEAHKEDIRNTMIIFGVLIVLGLAGFISMFWLQSYRSTKRSLQDTNAITEEVMTSLPVGLIATDKDGKIAFYNNAAERITGLSLTETKGKDPDSILPNLLCGLKKYLDRGDSIFEQEMECKFIGEKLVPVSVSASQIINEEGQFVGQVLIIRDLGEVRRLQDEIRRKEKLAAIGGLAAGVAHEIRNPLSSIKGIASYFSNKFDENGGDKEMAEVMIVEVDRLNRVISELLDFARPTDIKLKATNINSLIEHSVLLIEKEALSNDIEIELQLTEQDLFAEIDSDRFSQCLLNLYLNSIQAMEKGGKLTVKSALEGDRNLLIEIEDIGSGIKSDDLSKIFDPYFTTKSKGTGLGLAIVHKIIEAHDGNIKVQSVWGQHTNIKISIPRKKA